METKLFEVRDKMTMVVVMATRLTVDHPDEEYLLMRSGFGSVCAEAAAGVASCKAQAPTLVASSAAPENGAGTFQRLAHPPTLVFWACVPLHEIG